MRTIDLVVLILLVISAALAWWSHSATRDDCLAMVKPKTDSTPSWRAAKFTGEYERSGGSLYCLDTKGVKHSYRRSNNHVVKK